MNAALYLFILSLLLSGCSSQDSYSPSSADFMEPIKGRDQGGPRLAVYRMRVPNSWIRRDPLPDESLLDTTKALCEFIIHEDKKNVRIFIHNFPTDSFDQRIPPQSQVVRWQRQFAPLYANLSSTQPQAFSGYSGLLFTGIGKMNEEEIMVLGWTLLLAPEHYRKLLNIETAETAPLYKQMRADVTIKAIGARTLVEKHQIEIIAFARSFELIEEIPQSL